MSYEPPTPEELHAAGNHKALRHFDCSLCRENERTQEIAGLRARVATLTKERDAAKVRAEDLERTLVEIQTVCVGYGREPRRGRVEDVIDLKARADTAETACEGLREALEMARDWIDEGPGDPERVAVERAAVDAALAAAPVKRQVKP